MDLSFIHDAVKSLQTKFKLTDFEALQIAVQVERNELFAHANEGPGTEEDNALSSIASAINCLVDVIETELVPVLKNDA